MIGYISKRLVSKEVVYPLSFGILFLFMWEYGVEFFDISTLVLPAPTLLIDEFVSNTELFIDASKTSIWFVVFGYVIGSLIGISFAIFMYTWQAIERSLYPFLILVFIIPKIVLAPILVLWFGAGTVYFLSIPVLLVFFPVLENTLGGLKGIPEEMKDLSRNYQSSLYFRYRHVFLPHALPHIGAGLKIGMKQAVIGVIVAEFVAPEQGLGYFMILGTQVGQPTITWIAIVLVAVYGLVLYKVVEVTEQRLIFWKEV